MPSLLETIVDIAMHGSESHQRRQSDVYRSIKTLAQLTERLKMDGFITVKVGFTFVFCRSAGRLLKANDMCQPFL